MRDEIFFKLTKFSLIWKSFKKAIRKGATCSQNKVISWALEPFEDLEHFGRPNHVWLKKLICRVFQSTRKWSWTFVWLNDFFGVMRFLDRTLGILGIFPFQCSLYYLWLLYYNLNNVVTKYSNHGEIHVKLWWILNLVLVQIALNPLFACYVQLMWMKVICEECILGFKNHIVVKLGNCKQSIFESWGICLLQYIFYLLYQRIYIIY